MLLLCYDCLEMCVNILGYDPMHRDEPPEGVLPAI